jgi:Na+/proline symporter
VTRTDHAQLAAQRTLARINEIIVVVIAVAALVGVLVGGESGEAIDAAVIVVLCVVPWLRVVWLVGRWRRIGDVRFVAVGVTLLTLTVGGVLLSTLVK